MVVFILFTVSTMSDEESSSGTPATVSVHTRASNQAGNIHRPSLLQVKPPPPLNLADCSAKGGSCGSKLGSTLLLFRNFQRKERNTRRLFFFAPSGRAPWKINPFPFTASEDSNKVDTVIVKFDEYFTGDVNETYESFKFNQRNQEAGENFDAYLTALRNMTDTCNFCTCPTMKDSLIRDRIVLGIRKEDARKRLLQERKLDLKKCIDICRTSEGATTHMQAIGGKLEEVHRINKAKGPPKTS